ncbi:acid phosphatase [Methylomonas sp. MgM2]
MSLFYKRRISAPSPRRATDIISLACLLIATSCASQHSSSANSDLTPPASKSTLNKIDVIVVIYAENRSFDNLYGLFPGANGIAEALARPESYIQTDRDGKSVLPHLPPVWNSKDSNWNFVGSLDNRPFQINAPPGGSPTSNGIEKPSPDLIHRFYNHQLQINNGRNDQFAAFSNAGGLTMGYYNGSDMAMWKLAQEYTLADNFFMAAYGGSFLNHFWLICACTPYMAPAPEGRVSVLDPLTGKLAVEAGSALQGPPKYLGDLNFTPADPDSQRSYAIDFTPPPFQPSNTPPAKTGNLLLADGNAKGASAPLTPQNAKTIGDTLSDKQIDWVWYAGAWDMALADGTQAPDRPRKVIFKKADGAPNFQPHHQPFNYFSRFDPRTEAGRRQRAEHFKDYRDLQQDIANGTLPAVVFYKPQGSLNQHPGYSDVMSGDQHIAELIKRLQASPQWPNMFIVVTYDENGGFWDHVSPPKGDRWGPGTRIPAIFISPFVKKHYIDSTQYDTTSIIKLISRRFGLEPLPGVRENMGDLTDALE